MATSKLSRQYLNPLVIIIICGLIAVSDLAPWSVLRQRESLSIENNHTRIVR